MADKQLLAIRRDFVNRASDPVITNLMDDLFQDGILTERENEFIAENSRGRADKASKLIDTVRKKGHEASSKMIFHLKNSDPSLFSCIASSDNTDSVVTDNEKKEKKDDAYPVTPQNMNSRVALLITNVTFANKNLNRNGADKDEENMEVHLKAMGYKVVKYKNLTGKEMDDAVLKFSKLPQLKETDSVWVVIMSHGKLGAILGVNWKDGDEKPDEFKVNNIYQYLNSENCPALLNKPKVIIIQACRGEERGSVLVSDCAGGAQPPQPVPYAADAEFEDDSVRYVHKEKDFIALLSSTPNAVSYRHPEHGSLLIQYIVDVFKASVKTDDIEELFRKVMRRFESLEAGNRRQMPTKDRCTLTKRFFVLPDL